MMLTPGRSQKIQLKWYFTHAPCLISILSSSMQLELERCFARSKASDDFPPRDLKTFSSAPAWHCVIMPLRQKPQCSMSIAHATLKLIILVSDQVRSSASLPKFGWGTWPWYQLWPSFPKKNIASSKTDGSFCPFWNLVDCLSPINSKSESLQRLFFQS